MDQVDELDLSCCRVADLVSASNEVFHKYFKLKNDKGSGSKEPVVLYVVEQDALVGSHLRLRRLNSIEVCFLSLMTLSISHEPDSEDPFSQKLLELKLNYNASIFAHRFKNKNDRVVNQRQIWENQFGEYKFVIVNQIRDSDAGASAGSNSDRYSEFEDEVPRKPEQVFKQFIVRVMRRKPTVSDARTLHTNLFCQWPSCLQEPMQISGNKTSCPFQPPSLVQSRNQVSNSTVKQVQEGEAGKPEGKLFQIKIQKKRPESSYKNNQKNALNGAEDIQNYKTTTKESQQLNVEPPSPKVGRSQAPASTNQINLQKKYINKVPALLDLEWVQPHPLLKIMKKLLTSKQASVDKEFVRQRQAAQEEKKLQMLDGQVLINEAASSILGHSPERAKIRKLLQFPKYEMAQPEILALQNVPLFCAKHQQSQLFLQFNLNVHAPLAPKHNSNTFCKILGNENFDYWKEDLRGCLAFELLNKHPSSEMSIFRELIAKIFDYVVNHQMRPAQPSISHIIATF